MVTQKDVAEHAGVSFITVSRVINNKGNVKPKTRKRVLRAISELNYYPNSFAQGLNANKVQTLGVIPYLPSGVIAEETSYYRRLLIGIERHCLEQGFDVLLSTQRSNLDGFDALKPYYERKAAGLIFLGVDARRVDFMKIKKDGIPCTVIGDKTSIWNSAVCHLDSDNSDGTRKITEYLIKNGHRKIAYLHVNRWTQDTTERLDSFRAVLAEHQLALPEKFFFRGDFTPNSGKDCARKIFQMKGEQPSAIVAATDLMAIGILDGANSLGMKVPEDLSVVGFDGHEIGNYTSPPLATVVQNLEVLGYRAAELVIKQIQGRPIKQQNHIFPVVFEPRGSIRKT